VTAGPVATRLVHAAPFLQRVASHLAASPGALARAVEERRAAGHLCILCGAPAGAVVVVWPLQAAGWDLVLPGPVWADLCHRHLSAITAETIPGDWEPKPDP
jgi:hypothetical protein